ncbi:MAG: hypothetical protein AAGF92_02120 [Myxococcota bacterium]
MPIADLLTESINRQFANGLQVEAWAKDWASRWCEGQGLAATVRKIEARAERPITVAFFMPMLVSIQLCPVGFFYIHAPLTTDGLDFEFVSRLLQTCNGMLAPT